MSTNDNEDNQDAQEPMSRREAMRRSIWGAAGMIAAGGLSSRGYAAPAEKNTGAGPGLKIPGAGFSPRAGIWGNVGSTILLR